MTKPKPKPEQPKVEDLDQQEKDDLAEANAPADETTADLARWIAAQDDPEAAKAALDELAGNEVGVSNDPGAGDEEQRVAAGNDEPVEATVHRTEGPGEEVTLIDVGGETISLREAHQRGMKVTDAHLQELIDGAGAPAWGIGQMDLDQLTDRMAEIDVDFAQVDAGVLADEPAAVRAAYFRSVIEAHAAGDTYPPATDWLEDEPDVDVQDTDALAAATASAPEPEPATDGLQEFRGVSVGEMVKVKPNHRMFDEPSVYAGHTGRVIEIIDSATHAEEGCPFLVDFGDDGREPTSFHRDEIDRVVEL